MSNKSILLAIVLGSLYQSTIAAALSDIEASSEDYALNESQFSRDRKLWDLTMQIVKDSKPQELFIKIDNLLEEGANPHAWVNETGASAIELAFIARKFKLLSLLLNPEYNNNTDALIDNHERSYLSRAYEDGDNEMISFLTGMKVPGWADFRKKFLELLQAPTMQKV
jgi:hypothetical protein